jgi:hypothetical protein
VSTAQQARQQRAARTRRLLRGDSVAATNAKCGARDLVIGLVQRRFTILRSGGVGK